MLLKCHYHLHPLVESSKGGGCWSKGQRG
jgi:hypothetical protein